MPADVTTTGDAPPPDGPTETVTGVDISAARAALNDVDREPGAAKPDPIVVADNVVRQFGGLTAVDVEHVEIQRGVITALIGPNGAGKTTFFNLLTGFDRPEPGRRGRSTAPASTRCRPTRSPGWAWSGPSSSPRCCRR